MATYHPVITATGGQEAKKTMRMALTVASAVGLVALSVHVPALAPNRRHMLRAACAAAASRAMGARERGRGDRDGVREGEKRVKEGEREKQGS
jgi:hypothetical protein